MAVEVVLLLEDVLELDEVVPLDEVAMRLVEALRADDMLLPLLDADDEVLAFEDDALEVTETAGLSVEAELL